MSNRSERWQDLRDSDVRESIQKRFTKLVAKTKGHQNYINAIKQSTVTICIGPPGTGKSFCACGIAAEMLKNREIDKIVIARPLVQCDEEVGILPGELQEKVAPFIAPLLDAFGNWFSAIDIEKMIFEEKLEICPLAFMRGRTFKNSVVIVDEAQNATYKQLQMALTRFGENSKVIVNGDTSQTDIANGYNCPLIQVINRIKGNPEISVVKLGREDICRHPLIQYIDEKLSNNDYSGDDNADVVIKGGDTWYREICPKCSANAWFNNGNECDINVKNVTKIKCWKCTNNIETFFDYEKGEVNPSFTIAESYPKAT